MRLKHSIPRKALEGIEFVPEGSGEAGWMVSLREGFSFDPMASDRDRFVSCDNPEEVLDFVVYTAAKSASAADTDSQ